MKTRTRPQKRGEESLGYALFVFVTVPLQS